MFNNKNSNISEKQKEVQSEKPTYKESKKFIIGCQAAAGIPISEISKESGMSREYIYQQKEKVEARAESLDESTEKGETIELNKEFIKRAILILTLYCRSTLEGIQRALEQMFQIKPSIGYISGVINEAAQRAQAFDDGIRLEGIKQGANDEIFQGGTPILTGIDAESSYIYLLEEAKDRTSETWETYMEDRKECGLELDTSINDGAAGLIAGVSKTYPEAEIQRDVFHGEYELGKEVSKVERKAYAGIKEEDDLRSRAAGKRPHQRTREKLEKAIPKAEEAIKAYDIINILYTWLKELFGFSGYSYEETVALVRFVLDEMEKAAADFPGLRKECEKIRKALPSLLSFINRLEKAMGQSAGELGIPFEAFQLMYRQLRFGITTQEYQDIEYQLVRMLMEKYNVARMEFQKLLRKIKKASSLVENLNGRIRDYIDIKRIIPTRFFVLLKVYFNTKRYKRSRCPERVGKSPLELLTGKPQPEFLEALGY